MAKDKLFDIIHLSRRQIKWKKTLNQFKYKVNCNHDILQLVVKDLNSLVAVEGEIDLGINKSILDRCEVEPE